MAGLHNNVAAEAAKIKGKFRLANTTRKMYIAGIDEGRKRVIGLMAAILASRHMQTADDLFGGPQGSPARTI
jgi:hypothetical protein